MYNVYHTLEGGGQFIENQNFAVITIDTFYQSVYFISMAF